MSNASLLVAPPPPAHLLPPEPTAAATTEDGDSGGGADRRGYRGEPRTHVDIANVDRESCRTVSDCHYKIVRHLDRERTRRGGEHGDAARNYYLNTSHLLFQYCEKKRSTSAFDDHLLPPVTGGPAVESPSRRGGGGDSPEDMDAVDGVDSVMDEEDPVEADTRRTTPTKRRPNRRFERFFDVQAPDDDSPSMDVIVQRYNAIVDPTGSVAPPVYRRGPYDACEACGKEHTLVMRHGDSTIVCTDCGACTYAPVLQSRPSYRTTRTSPTTMTLYKRINHFDDWISQFQAKETIVVPDEVYRKIAFELRKRAGVAGKATPQTIRAVLRKLRLNKYYEHIPRIMNRLQGTPPPTIDRCTENKLRVMFRLIQEPFARHSPSTRRNFSSYSYILSKFFGLLGRRDLQRHFPLLKSRSKLYAQDTIWRGICRELGWKFEPSM